ncbi:potassium channel family protein [Flexivirga meconopsidis]|uniref:potassium channel family protein n=1 Tax=Flexivirga meconopsidis TaxID=2977121 RepID=UPI00223F150A|nr:TrkA family potassium uptake protein [Flexivirga meconopsidis]
MPSQRSALVVGLGRFGAAVAQSLVHEEWEVLAVDESMDLVQKYADTLTHTARVDSTDPDALVQLGAADFERAVVGIGSDMEASVLTVVNLVDLGVEEIWAKAVTPQHARILERIGAHHVVFPERAMGERVAHMVTGSLEDYIEFDDDFAIARTLAPRSLWGRSLTESALRTKLDITVVGVKRPGTDFTYARPETVVVEGDELVVCGRTHTLEKFAQQSER